MGRHGALVHCHGYYEVQSVQLILPNSVVPAASYPPLSPATVYSSGRITMNHCHYHFFSINTLVRLFVCSMILQAGDDHCHPGSTSPRGVHRALRRLKQPVSLLSSAIASAAAAAEPRPSPYREVHRTTLEPPPLTWSNGPGIANSPAQDPPAEAADLPGHSASGQRRSHYSFIWINF